MLKLINKIGNNFMKDYCMFHKFNQINHSGLSRHMMQALRLANGYKLEFLRLGATEKLV